MITRKNQLTSMLFSRVHGAYMCGVERSAFRLRQGDLSTNSALPEMVGDTRPS